MKVNITIVSYGYVIGEVMLPCVVYKAQTLINDGPVN